MNNTNSNKRFDWVDNAKGIVIIMVVHVHVLNGLENYFNFDPGNYYFYCRTMIRSFYMPFFFFTAGMFVKTSLEKRGATNFIINKGKGILWPYFVWSLVFGLIRYSMPSLVNTSISLPELFSKILLDPINHMWFLYVLFIYFLVYAMSHKKPWLLVVIAILSIILKTSNQLVSLVMGHFGMFVFGMIFARQIIELVNRSNIFILLIFLALSMLRQPYILEQNSITVLLFTTAEILSIFIISKFIAQYTRILKYIGKNSLCIYLIHPLGFVGSRLVLYRIFNIDNLVIHVIIGTIASIVAPILFYEFTKILKLTFLFSLDSNSTPMSRGYLEN